MRVVRLLGGRQLTVVDVPEPEPIDDHVVVKVMASAICGTERHAYEDGMTNAALAAGVTNAGHEGAGVVWKARGGSRLKEGDRVNLFSTRCHCGGCRHCASGRWVLCQGEPPAPGFGYHAQFVLRREDFCLPLSADVEFPTASLFGDVLGTAYRAIRRIRITAGETVLVLGQGPIGLAATMICRFMGASVIAADRLPFRVQLAERCGADTAVLWEGPESLAALRDAAPEGVDAAIDCAGAQSTRVACLAAVRAGGRVALVGLGAGLELDGPTFRRDVFLKDLELVASWYSNPLDMFELEDMVRRGLNPERMITHVLPLEQAAEGFAAMFGGESGKVILEPWPVSAG
jgi:threonine dehydrogenase-like Zn-dependent dehydrogenase